MKKTLVSIIIPCYNYGKYLEQAVLSAVKQTHKNIEVIIINDGSIDNTKEVAAELVKRFPVVRYYGQQNRGIITTRNRGVSLAKGQYLIQLDADDWLHPKYVEKTLRAAEKHKADVVYTQAKIFGRVNFVTNFPDFNIEFLKHNNFMHASSLVKRSVFNGDRQYDKYLGGLRNEDWDLFLDACMDGKRAVRVNEPLLNYRKHAVHKSRSDNLGQDNLFKDALVRHHIYSKQNAKHPKEMWYFSPYITMLKEYIDETLQRKEEAQVAAETAANAPATLNIRVPGGRTIENLTRRIRKD